MSTQPAVFITVPKYVAITPIQATAAGHVVTNIGSTVLPKIRPAPAQISATDITDETTGSCTESTAPKGKKRRLDHLSWEEKVQRKKLKNRVAAQTSRDRKKARMEDMEHEIQDLTDRTEILVNKCESLQVINDSLLEKNQKLDMEVEILRQQLQELQKQQQLQQQLQQQQQQQQKIATCAGCESLLNGSAVSNNTDPLPQGSNPKDSQSSQETITVLKLKQQLKKSATASSLWRVITLCLLYKICCYPTSKSTKERSMMQNLMPESWKNLPKACLPTSPQTWKQAIDRAMRLLPKYQAEQSDCLDQWWGPQQSAWNPANIKQASMATA